MRGCLEFATVEREAIRIMQQFRLQLTACVRRLDEEYYLAETAEFPEISCLRRSRKQAVESLGRLIRRFARNLTPTDLVRRQPIASPVSEEFTLEVESPKRQSAWETPVRLAFTVLRWSHPTDGCVAWVPALGIQVVAAHDSEVTRLLPSHIRGFYQRIRKGVTLRDLAYDQRTTRVFLLPLSLDVPILTPQQRHQEANEAQQKQKSVLKEIATNLAADSGPPTYCRDAVVEDLAMILTAQPPRSVLLVGPSGVGKTAIVNELVRQRAKFGLGEHRFWSTSGSRLVAGMSCFGAWQERCQHLVDEAAREDAIVHLGTLFELMEVGRSESSGVGIAQFLRLPIVRGKLIAIAEATPEQFQLIERLHPELANAFDVLRVEPPSLDHCREILSAVVAASPPMPVPAGTVSAETRPLMSPEAVTEVDHLHRRFATYSASPGRPLRFLTNLLHDRLQSAQDAALFVAQTGPAPASPLSPEDVIEAFARETGLPRWLLDEQATFDPDLARRRLRQRVRGQDGAVDEVVEWLELIKSQLVRPQRPLASLMFIGPTGVGKTELAKALAELLFGDERRLTRFDMSEFADPWSAQRLIGSTAQAEGLLTARVREQPFCVLLLDEFEKADPSVFDLLLQVLGEARLTDAGGRLADFTNAVIILTSNLGAESFQRGRAGFVPTTTGDHEAFLESVRQFLRPELFNRFDRIVSFHALSAETIQEITHLELDQLRRRDGLQFRLSGWECSPAACQWLGERGFDARYGARPLKRAIERLVLAPLAERLVRIPATQSVQIALDVVDGLLCPTITAVKDAVAQTATPTGENSALAVSLLQQRTALLAHCPAVRHWQNDRARVRQMVDREHRRMLRRTAVGKPWSPPPGHPQRQKMLADLGTFLDRLGALEHAVAELEDRCWLDVLEQKSRSAGDAPLDGMQRCQQEARRLAMELYYRQFAEPDRAVLAVFGGDRATLGRLAGGYRSVCQRRGWSLREWEYAATKPSSKWTAIGSDRPEEGPLYVRLAESPFDAENLPEPLIGLAFEIQGTGAFAELSGEAGTHRFQKDPNVHDCAVFASEESMATYRPPPKIGRRSATAKSAAIELRRTYNLTTRSVLDRGLGQPVAMPFSPDRLDLSLEQLMELQVERRIQALITANE